MAQDCPTTGKFQCQGQTQRGLPPNLLRTQWFWWKSCYGRSSTSDASPLDVLALQHCKSNYTFSRNWTLNSDLFPGWPSWLWYTLVLLDSQLHKQEDKPRLTASVPGQPVCSSPSTQQSINCMRCPKQSEAVSHNEVQGGRNLTPVSGPSWREQCTELRLIIQLTHHYETRDVCGSIFSQGETSHSPLLQMYLIPQDRLTSETAFEGNVQLKSIRRGDLPTKWWALYLGEARGPIFLLKNRAVLTP